MPTIPPLLKWMYDLSLVGALEPATVYEGLGKLMRMEAQHQEHAGDAANVKVVGDFTRFLKGEVSADEAKAFIKLCTRPLISAPAQKSEEDAAVARAAAALIREEEAEEHAF